MHLPDTQRHEIFMLVFPVKTEYQTGLLLLYRGLPFRWQRKGDCLRPGLSSGKQD